MHNYLCVYAYEDGMYIYSYNVHARKMVGTPNRRSEVPSVQLNMF